MPGGAQRREVRGGALVGRDQFVHLVPGETAAPRHEIVESAEFRLMRRDKGIYATALRLWL